MRGFCIDGEPYFVAKDICDILDLSNPSMTIQSLDEDERAKYCLGRQGETWCVNESGLYHLIFQSRKPEAKAFRRKVTMEILPTLRRTGRYEVKPRRWSQRFERPKEFLDLRAEPYELKMLNGYAVRVVVYEDVEWYSVADILRSMQVATSAYQTAASLSTSSRELTRKIYIFGSTHPAWFTTITGLRLIVAGSHYLKSNAKK
ncbi:MAG: Bro-N domain-containing protein [Rikenellaceae bacterium]|nr:Bro-N domain-containing protein [Rikenellaceae bacterium]